ncbi:MAG: hypothetical protein SCALA702_20850 [Melioribacteraceae bacterium]|nr:MAG: hypothetical protein SCALA702_20850 [Melioribacteraceae bacterium]
MEVINSLSQNPIVISLAWTLFHSIWQAALILLGASVIVRFIIKPEIRYRVFNGVYVLILAASVITFIQLSEIENSSTATENIFAKTILPGEIQSINSPHTTVWSDISMLINSYSHIAVILWISGIIIILFKSFLGIFSLQFARRKGIRADFYGYDHLASRLHMHGYKFSTPELIESALCKVPMLVGFFKPAIILPLGMINNLPYHYVEAVITHELAHLIRKDNIIIYIQNVVDTIYFFNPAVHLLSGMINREREIICDEMAVNLPLNKVTYAKALAFFTEFTSNPGYTTAALYNGKNQLYNRIERILGVTMKNDFSGIKLMISIIIVSAGLLFASSQTFTTLGQDTLSKPLEPKEVKELPPVAGMKVNEPDMIFEIPPAPEIVEISPVEEITELPPAPPLPEISDSAKRVISFEEVAGIPYKNVRIETDANYNVLSLSIGGKSIPQKDFDKYGDLFKKAFIHFEEEQKRLQESMEKLGVSMKVLKESMSKLESLSERMEIESAEREAESTILEKEARELERESLELEAQSALVEEQAREMERRSKVLAEQAIRLQKDADAHELIHKEMISDGIVEPDQPLNIRITKSEFYINDVKQPDAVKEKYLKLYIKHFGEDVVNEAIKMEIRK